MTKYARNTCVFKYPIIFHYNLILEVNQFGSLVTLHILGTLQIKHINFYWSSNTKKKNQKTDHVIKLRKMVKSKCKKLCLDIY